MLGRRRGGGARGAADFAEKDVDLAVGGDDDGAVHEGGLNDFAEEGDVGHGWSAAVG